MAKLIWKKTDRLFKDGNSGPVVDGSVTVRLGGTSTLAAVYSDDDLSSAISGSVINFNSNGYLEISGNLVNLYVADDVTIDLLIQATGFNGSAALTVPDVAIAETAETAADYRTGFKNALSNGDFSSWSGSTSGSAASGDDDGDETADGWYLAQPNAASNEWSRQDGAGTGARYGYRFGRPSGSSSTNKIRVWKTLTTEEVYRLRGQTVTLSVSVKAGANFSGTALNCKLATGTTASEDGDGIEAGSWGGFAQPINQNQAITTTITRYEFSATLGAGIKEAGVQFSYTGVGTAGANDWVQIEDVQIEISAAATAFESPPELISFLLNKASSVGRAIVKALTAVAQWDLINSKGADIASASSIDLSAATGNFVDITGTTTITALGTAAVGVVRKVRTVSNVSFTHNGTSLIMPGGQSLTTAANDVLEFTSLGSGNWRCTGYASGTPKFANMQVNNNGLRLLDSGGDHILTIIPGSNLSADRSFTLVTGDAARALDISAADVTITAAGAALIDDANNTAQRTTLGLGTSATVNTGTSGATIPLNDSDKTMVGTLTLRKNAGGVLTVDRTGDDGTIVAIQQDGSTEGSISVSGTTVAYNTFLGSHWAQLADWSTPNLLKGTIIETIDDLCRWVWDEWFEESEPARMEEREVAPNIVELVEVEPAKLKRKRRFYRGDLAPGSTYTDKEGIEHRIVEEVSDRLPRGRISDTQGSKRVYGAFLHWEHDDGAPDMYVGALGAGFIRVAPGEKIAGGELIESNGDGCGRVQADDVMRSSTVAKITSTVAIETYSDGSKLYPCTLHCG